ncbi:MAG: YsnF/AvaK domain-containing protein [Actinomycetota bacterium]|nr:YsnF/AvaK domain-containing protein [Actinomycetota bacterium]
MDSEQTLTGDAGISVVRLEEQLRVATERVGVERLRVSKRVVTETVTRAFEVRREELVVESSPIASGAPGDAGPAGSGPIEIVLHEEQIVVETRLVPVERVRIDVERVVEQRPVSEVVRREEVVVENLGSTGDAAVGGGRVGL